MKKVFCHRYKWSHAAKRKKYRKQLKEGKIALLSQSKDGWLYGLPDYKQIAEDVEKALAEEAKK